MTVKSPADGDVQDRVAEAGEGGRVRPDGKVHARPRLTEGETDKATVPVKVFTAVTVTVEAPEDPAMTAPGVTAPAAMLKSVKVNFTLVGTTREPLVPTMVTVKLPAGWARELQDKVAAAGGAGRVKLDGVIAPQVRPTGKGVSDNTTVPAKPFEPVTVIVVAACWPTFAGGGEVAAMVNSVNENVAATGWVAVPGEPKAAMATVKV